MSGLGDMLRGMAPKLDTWPYEFRHLSETGPSVPPGTFALIQEEEGPTLVAAVEADGSDSHFARITLSVHSDLKGVGLTAAVSGALADAGIACNVIAACHHDHLFVPWERREEAMEILTALSANHG